MIVIFKLTDLDAGLVGLILSNTLSLTNVFQFCVRQSALVENQVGAEGTEVKVNSYLTLKMDMRYLPFYVCSVFSMEGTTHVIKKDI